MAGALDEGSRAIGDLEASVRGLSVSFDKHCLDDDRRHAENIAALRDNTAAIGELGRKLDDHSRAVSSMRPQIAALQISRKQVAIAGSLGMISIGLLIWGIESGLTAIVAWARAHWN